MSRHRGVLVDIDGTLWEDGIAIDGAAEALAELRRMGLIVRLTTNTTRKPRRVLVQELTRRGFAVARDEVHTAPLAAAAWLRQHGIERAALYLNEATFEDFEGIAMDDVAPQAVVAGDLAAGWTYATLNRAFRWVMDGARLVAIQKNRYWRSEGALVLDAGPFIAALEYATGETATLVGKPSAPFFEAAARSMGFHVGEVLVVGDDVESDIRGAQAAGCTGVLVRTGKYRRADEQGAPAPDLVIDSIAMLPDRLAV